MRASMLVLALLAVAWARPLPDCPPLDHMPLLPAAWLLQKPAIQNQEGLDERKPYLAPILFGGLGTVMFQLAAAHSAAWNSNLTCVVGYWKHWNRAHVAFDPWGGHPAPAPVSLQAVFPALTAFSFKPALDVTPDLVWNKFAYEVEWPDEFIPLPSRRDFEQAPFLHGIFLHHRYWHGQRDRVLSLFAAHPAIRDYAALFYGKYFEDSSIETVSIHLRLGYEGEPSPGRLSGRTFPPEDWLASVASKMFAGSKYLFLVFSDNISRAREVTQPLVSAGRRVVYVDDTVVVSLHLMSLCQHHVLTSSAISFWGAYLDRNQPTGGRTVLHPSFFVNHGRAAIPYPEWLVVSE
eukprot:m.29104 g.29104  ORF g.29104 m.29104 type:complete len:349 (+) comp40412_c0_seq8:31-1077(+)